MSERARPVDEVSRFWLVLSLVLGIPCVGVLIGAYLLYADFDEKTRCPFKLKGIYELVMQDSGELRNDSLDNIRKTDPQERNWGNCQCPVAHQNYVYRPFTGVRRHWGEKGKDPPPNRMILWCPSACHRGGRNVMLEDKYFLWVSETDFQAALKNNCELASIQYYDDKKVRYSPNP